MTIGKYLALCIGLFSVVLSAGEERRAPSGLELLDFKVCGKVFHLEVANTDSSRQKGLMERDRLGDDEGMIFVFSGEQERSFWMKNVLIDLDILFFNNDGQFVSGAKMTPDSPLVQDMFKKRWLSKGPARFVVEVAGGTFEGLETKQNFSSCILEPLSDFAPMSK